MNLLTAQAKQDELYTSATRLLADKDIENLLTEYGTLTFVGSYAAKLMVKPDIDMELVNPEIDANRIYTQTRSLYMIPERLFSDFI